MSCGQRNPDSSDKTGQKPGITTSDTAKTDDKKNSDSEITPAVPSEFVSKRRTLSEVHSMSRHPPTTLTSIVMSPAPFPSGSREMTSPFKPEISALFDARSVQERLSRLNFFPAMPQPIIA